MKKTKLLALLAALMVPLVVTAQETLTVADGTSTNSYVPMYGFYNDSRFKNEFVYPARMLGGMNGRMITTITFYASSNLSWNSPLELTIDEVEDTLYTSSTPWKATADAQVSWSGTCSIVDGQWVIVLDAPYVYGGGNLLLSVRNTAAGTQCPYSSFLGINPGYAAGGYSTGGNPSTVTSLLSFLPKVTFGTSQAGSFCYRPTAVHVSDITADGASFSWESRGTESSWAVYLNDELVSEVSNPSYSFSDLTANMEYSAGVRAICGDGDTSLMATIGFRTACEVITISSDPWIENFENWTTGNDGYDPCWRRYGFYSSYVPNVQTTSGPNGQSGKSLSCYAGKNEQPMFVILPEMETLEGMMVAFQAKSIYSIGSSFLQVGYITDPTDTATFHAVSAFNLLAADGWKYFESRLEGEDLSEAHRIAFRLHNAPGEGYNIYLDNIMVSESLTCSRPTALSVRDVTTNSAELYIEDMTFGGNYTVQVYADDTLLVNTIDAYDTVVSITDLAVNTPYMLEVVSNCSNGATLPIIFSFRTNCEAMELPVTLSFERNPANETPDCWKSYSGNAVVNESSSNAHSGSKYLKFHGATRNMVALPLLDQEINGLVMHFWTRPENTSNSNCGKFQVGYLTNDEDTSSFVAVATWVYNEFTGYDEKIVTMEDAPEGSRIAFLQKDCTTNYYWYVDDLSVEVFSDCKRPSGVSISDTTFEGAIIHAIDTNEIGNYCYAIYRGDTTLVDSAVFSGDSMQIDNLEDNTDYTVRLAAVCGSEVTSFVSASFRTLCGLKAIPYSNDFENEAAGAPVCWNKLKGNPNVDNSSSNAHSGTKYIKFQGATRNMLVMPQFEEEISGLQVRFWTRPESTSNASCGNFQVGYITDITDTNTFTPVNTWSYSDFSDYAEKDASMAGAPEGARIAFLQRDCNTNWFWYLDDVVVEPLAECQHPVSVSVNGVTTDEATAHVYDPINNGPFCYVLYLNDTTLVDSVVVADDSLHFADLETNSDYTVRVAAVCGSDVTSFVSTTFHTFCNAMSTPDTNGFEMDVDNKTPSCWTNLGGSTVVLSPSSYSPPTHEGSKYLKFSGSTRNMIAMPRTDVEISGLQVRFWTRPENTSNANCGNFQVGYITDLADTTTFTAVETWSYNDFADYEEMSISMANAPEGAIIAFLQKDCLANWYWFVDDVVVEPLPDCPRPVGVSVSDISIDNATIHVNDPSEVGSYCYVLYKNDTAFVDSIVFSSESVHIDGLSANTVYSVRVATVCGNEVTRFVRTSFRTLCGSISDDELPFTEGFESYSEVAGPILCWSYLGPDSSRVTVTVNSNRAHGGTHSFRFSGYATDAHVVMLPAFEGGINGLNLNLWLVAEDSVASGDLQIGYVYDDTTFVAINNLHCADYATMAQVEVSFADAPADARIALAQKQTRDSNYWWWIDDVTVDRASSCQAPVSLVVSGINATNATLTWNDDNGTGNYVVTCSNGDSVTVNNALTYTFSNLAPATQYTVGVRRICDGQHSALTSASFTTESLPCHPVTGLEVDATTYTSVSLKWTSEGEESEWQVNIFNTANNQILNATTHPFTVNGLTPATTYHAAVRPVCDSLTDWSDTISFTTDVCQPVTNVEVSNITYNSADVAWTGVSGFSNYEVEYGLTGIPVGQGTHRSATSNSIHLDGLEPEESYDVHVRTVCASGVESVWTSKSFTTKKNGIEEVTDGKVVIYPNPASSNVHITGVETGATVSVVDKNGRTVSEYKVQNNSIQINVSEMAKGTYYLRVVGDHTNSIHKLIVR